MYVLLHSFVQSEVVHSRRTHQWVENFLLHKNSQWFVYGWGIFTLLQITICWIEPGVVYIPWSCKDKNAELLCGFVTWPNCVTVLGVYVSSNLCPRVLRVCPDNLNTFVIRACPQTPLDLCFWVHSHQTLLRRTLWDMHVIMSRQDSDQFLCRSLNLTQAG